ncbi:MAG: hemin-degrading factor, partial [Kiritimatiellae bacterium]|jgi:putative hemin transport protein|nr:hemin-degrading factor [Kiritimatiellia bacterium]
MEAWGALVAGMRVESEETYPLVPVEVKPTTDSRWVDAETFRAAWDQMKDTHEFFPLLKRFGLSRIDALRLAGAERAQCVAPESFARVVTLAAERRAPIMVFVGNRGCIQIHTGPVKKVVKWEDWINVMDPGFTLHLRESRIAEIWVVRKPTSDGTVTSMELYDDAGNEIALLFGERKPGQTERGDWRQLLRDTI